MLRSAPTVVTTLARAGLLRPPRPDQAVAMGLALAYWGLSPAAGYAAHAARDPRRAAVVDPEGTLTYAEVDRVTNAVANGLHARGVRAGQPVGVSCGNTRAFVLAVVGVTKAGATAVLLNPAMSPAMLADVEESEGLVAVLADDDVLALAGGDQARPKPPAQPGRFVILTSGTTGRPKGAPRSAPTSLDPVVALLSVIPLKAGGTTVVASPLFHAWGFAQWLVALVLGSTVVLNGPFDAERTLASVEEHRADALVAVPVMLRRLLAVETAYDTSSLRVVAVSGSALPPDVATAFLDRFGEVLYDLYGSTEVAWVSIATPADLREAPGSVGRPPYGTSVELVDADESGTGRIFAGNGLTIEAYTSGESKETRDGLMATGDLGRWDDDGRLYVVGREDDMVVSGGENVFPGPVEDLLSAHPGVADVAVVGVPDEEFGQRLRAVVVRADASLTEDAVRDAVRAGLARHFVPRDVVFVDALPRNPAGKVLKRELGS